jgi:hypothetical protein
MNKNSIKLTEGELQTLIKESVKRIIKETSFDKAKEAYYKSYDNIAKEGPKATKRKINQMNNLYNHMNDRKQENINLEMPVKIVGGNLNGNYTMKEVMDNLPINGYVDGFRNSAYKDSKIVGYPKIKGYVGPMWDGNCIRYESQEVYDELSV